MDAKDDPCQSSSSTGRLHREGRSTPAAFTLLEPIVVLIILRCSSCSFGRQTSILFDPQYSSRIDWGSNAYAYDRDSGLRSCPWWPIPG